MRVAHVITGLNVGGAETMLTRLCAGLRKAGDEPFVLSLAPPGPIAEVLAKEGVEVRTAGLGSSASFLPAIARARRILKGVRPDVVQGWMYHGNVAASLSAAGAPVAWNVRCCVLEAHDSASGRLAYEACRGMSSRPAAIVYNSSRARSTHEAAGFRGRRAVVLANGFDTGRYAPSEEARRRTRRALDVAPDQPLVGLLGRYHPHKDHATFVAAARHASRRVPGLVAVIAGRGVDTSDELARLVQDAGIECRVLPEQPEPEALLSALDVACLSSRTESFPNFLGEAMACGVPCATTDVGEAAALVGETGRVVAPRDACALGDAVADLLALEPSKRRELGVLARERVRGQYGLDRVVADYRTFYSSLAEASE